MSNDVPEVKAKTLPAILEHVLDSPPVSQAYLTATKQSLSPVEEAFVDALVAGRSLAAAYKQAYNQGGFTDAAARGAAHEVVVRPAVMHALQARLARAKLRDEVENDLDQRFVRARLREIAGGEDLDFDSKQAMQALKMLGEASGVLGAKAGAAKASAKPRATLDETRARIRQLLGQPDES